MDLFAPLTDTEAGTLRRMMHRAAMRSFRLAEFAVPSSRHGRRGGSSDLRGMEKLLKSQPRGYRAQLVQKRLAGGMRVLQIKFVAPSPV